MRSFITFILFSFASAANAVDYYWEFAGVKYPGAQAACSAYYATNPQNNQGYGEATIASKDPTMLTATQIRCRWTAKPASNPNFTFGGYATILRRGDSCPDGATYNQATGECEKPPEDKCAARAGASSKFHTSGTVGDGRFTLAGPYISGPNEMCYDGCAVVVTELKGRFRTNGTYRVWGTKTATGAECGVGGPSVSNGDPNPTPPETPPTDVENKPCVYVTNPDGTQSCSSEKNIDKEGHYCGQVNGVQTCVTSPATKNDTKVDTTVSKTPNSDGTTNIVKTDVITKTSCTPVNKCTTTSTTRTTTTVVGSDGTVKSVSGTCTGKDCTTQNQDPDGNGNGNGTCTGKSCDPFSDEDGEVGEGGFYEPGTDTFESVLRTFQAGVSAVPVVQGAANFLAFNPSGSCPSGSVNVMGMHVQLDQWCSSSIPWPFIAAVILGIAAILSYRIAFT